MFSLFVLKSIMDLYPYLKNKKLEIKSRSNPSRFFMHSGFVILIKEKFYFEGEFKKKTNKIRITQFWS